VLGAGGEVAARVDDQRTQLDVSGGGDGADAKLLRRERSRGAENGEGRREAERQATG